MSFTPNRFDTNTSVRLSDSPGGSEGGAGEVELSGLKGDEERTLGGKLFTPVRQRAASESQRLLGKQHNNVRSNNDDDGFIRRVDSFTAFTTATFGAELF